MKTYSSKPLRAEEVRELNCILCSGTAQRFLMQVGVSRFVKCLDCGLVYQNPQPVFRDLQQRYQGDYFQYEIENEQNFFNLMKLGLEDIGLKCPMPSMFENGRFLDIGCATGLLCEYMKNCGWDSTGLDICGPSCAFGRRERQLNLINKPLEQAAFADQSFSLIHASHLIEHVVDPCGFFKEIYRIMSKKGFGIFTTPNIAGFQARIFGSSWRSAIEDHLFLFDIRSFTQLLEQSGFRILKKITWGGLAKGRAPGWIKRILDFMAKKMGFGDVMLFYFCKR
ncbi:MAG: class I SAM-dependent methyltransferase [Spirochaetales bacterium]|nr:class I SAM-dependent methyltransferase [Spirochaetales bacterium]